jgi:hypothetical protein
MNRQKLSSFAVTLSFLALGIMVGVTFAEGLTVVGFGRIGGCVLILLLSIFVQNRIGDRK